MVDQDDKPPVRIHGMMVCIDCGAEFRKRGALHKRCDPCAEVRDMQRRREGYLRRKAGLQKPPELGIGERRPLTIREAATLAEAERMEREIR